MRPNPARPSTPWPTPKTHQRVYTQAGNRVWRLTWHPLPTPDPADRGRGRLNAKGIAMAYARHRTRALDRIRTEPPVLDADMRPSDIADSLKRLRFVPGRAQTVRVADAEVRDFLVAAVTRQGERTR